jgi:hypothetical protein
VFKLLSILSLFVLAVGCNKSPHIPTDSEMRASVVKLDSPRGSCSGTQVEAPSGKKYILTAAHCLPLAQDGIMHVVTEDAGSYFSKVLEEDMTSDLLLLEPAPGVPAVKIAKDLSRNEHLKSYTHGAGYPTYSTEGSYVGEDIAQFVSGQIDSDADRAKCSAAKNKIEKMSFFGIDMGEVCTVKVPESVVTVKLVPGSSGGMVANDRGELMGVCSCGNQDFTMLVTLKDIQKFLSQR